MTRSRKRNGGFTLIELLIVIAIIGILASVVLVSLSSARDKAKNAKAYSAVKSAETAAEACLINGGKINTPTAGNVICNISGSTEKYPDISSTGFSWDTTAYGSGQTGGQGGLQWFAFTAYSGSKKIVCGMNWKNTTWWSLTWDFTGTAGCKTDGF